MLHIDPEFFDQAVTHMKVAAMHATDPIGLKVATLLPDSQRVEAIVLGALVALVGHPVKLANELHFTAGFPDLGAAQ